MFWEKPQHLESNSPFHFRTFFEIMIETHNPLSPFNQVFVLRHQLEVQGFELSKNVPQLINSSEANKMRGKY